MRKVFVVLLIFLFSLSAFSQTRLSVHLKRSQSEYDITFIVDTLKIFKDDFLYKEIPYPDSYAFYEDVSSGDYKFCYKNLFAENVEKNIVIREADNILGGQEVNLYIDQLQSSKITDNLFIKNLKNDETLIINLKFSGCFNSGSDTIKIFRKSNRYILKYKNKTRKLKSSEFQAIVKYETELRNLPKVGFLSTSSGFNEISINEEKFSYFEPSFFWGGYSILKESLKLK